MKALTLLAVLLSGCITITYGRPIVCVKERTQITCNDTPRKDLPHDPR